MLSATDLPSQRFLNINVGGRVYDTTEKTLLRHDGVLKNVVEGRQKLPRDEDGLIFIDRDGDLFAYVLNVMRRVRRQEVQGAYPALDLHLPPSVDPAPIIREMLFFFGRGGPADRVVVHSMPTHIIDPDEPNCGLSKLIARVDARLGELVKATNDAIIDHDISGAAQDIACSVRMALGPDSDMSLGLCNIQHSLDALADCVNARSQGGGGRRKRSRGE